MVFTWRESLSLGVIKYLKDPELVRYFAYIANKEREKYVENESRDFHCSLRVTREERYKKIEELKKRGLHHIIFSTVPINFPVPFTDSEWMINKKYLRKILYFREGFMKKNVELESGVCVFKNQMVSEKIKSINKYMKYHRYLRDKELDEALFDFMLFNDYEDAEYPYILLEYDFDGQPLISIIG